MRKMLTLAALLAAFAATGAQAQTAPAPHAGHPAPTPAPASGVQTTPADGWMGSTAPTAFSAAFPHPMQLTTLSLKSGSAAEAAVPVPEAAAATRVSVPLPALSKGNHVLTWSARGADGHVMTGVVRFMVH